MPDLATFQLAFGAAMRRDTKRGALERQPGFAVYRNTMPASLIDVLRGAYPMVEEILGPEAFAAAAFDFQRARPPADPVLVRYGAGFADFLGDQPWAADVPYLADVAAIEWLRAEALDAADRAALAWSDVAALGGEGWAALRLPLHPAARFGWFRTPARTIWQAHCDGFDTLEPEWRAEGILITRPAGRVALRGIDAAEHRLLSGLRLGESVGQATAATAAVYRETDFSRAFTNLVEAGAFARPPQLERT